jgi:hypothetical protein
MKRETGDGAERPFRFDADLDSVALDGLNDVFPRRTAVTLRHEDAGGIGVYRTDGDGSLLGLLSRDLEGDVDHYSVEIRSVRRPSPSGDQAARITVRVSKRLPESSQRTEDPAKALSEADEDVELFSREALERISADARLQDEIRGNEALARWIDRVVAAPTWDEKRTIVRRLLSEDESCSKVVERIMGDQSSEAANELL